jgi:hypothetical protein
MDRNIIDFTGLSSWCFRFMKRNNLCMRAKTKVSRKMPAEYKDKIIEFHRFIINARKREKWNSWIESSDLKEMPTGRTQKPTISKVCEWVKNSWDAVKAEIVFKSFKKCGIINSLDGTEDNLLFEDSDDLVPDSEELSSVSSSEDDNFCGSEDED